MKRFASVALVIALVGCVVPPQEAPKPVTAAAPAALTAGDIAALTQKVSAEIDDLHASAAAADEARYFGHYARDATFLGTDAKERWDMAAFRAYAHPHFAAGKGWSYKSVRRSISFTSDGQIAWFDEDLTNERIGDTRGTGVLARDASGRYLLVQYNLTLTIPNERVSAVHALVTGQLKEEPKGPDLRTRYKAAYDKAIEAATAGDLTGARTLLTALVPEAKTKPDDDLEFWLHNELTWLAWEKGDLPGALAEVDEAHFAVEHAILPEPAKNKLRLHELWDRAYVMLEIALAGPVPQRTVSIARAKDAKAAYDALATRENDHDGAAVLESFFDTKTGKAKDAAIAGKKVDLDKDSDVQDLYVLARAFEASGDKDLAMHAQAKICGANSYLMKPLILAERKKEGHACP